MSRLSIILTLIISTLSFSSIAQERNELLKEDLYADPALGAIIEVDETLFRLSADHRDESYERATRYYRAAGALRRRGLYYTIAEMIVEPVHQYFRNIDELPAQSNIALYSASNRYRVGLAASHTESLPSSWHFSSSLWAQTGRDMFVEGVFSNSLSPDLRLSRSFDTNHFLTIDFEGNFSTRGLQYSSTSEAFSLSGNNYYNPTWGFYDGKVRNSRVRRQSTPSLAIHYQQPLSGVSTLIVEGATNYSRQANSSIGWYNATTPMPDYYRKMPSFMVSEEAKDTATDAWLTSDTRYTQINWDEIVQANRLAKDGNAFYTLEDRVEREIATDFAALIHTTLKNKVQLTYGIRAALSSTRKFKEMRDLLGAKRFIDYDIFIDESYNKTLPLDNNLRNPDNSIGEGERFGYDYTLRREFAEAILRANYRASRLDFDLEATIGSESYTRQGYYEKERFAGAASYGRSATTTTAPYLLRATIGYAAQANKYFALKIISSRLAPLARNLFLNEYAANYLSPRTSGERINSAALAFRLNHPTVALSGEIYALQSRNGNAVYSLYDDLSATMCRAVISQIGYSSIGCEVVADIFLHPKLNLCATLAAGRYFYDSNPQIALYNDYDLGVISDPTESLMNGIEIGNAPQIAATLTATYFGFSRYIINLSSSLSARRFERPSIARRSQRVLTQAFLSAESAATALEQQRLGDIYDMELSIMRFFYLEQGSRLSLRLAISNLLGDNDRIEYAKESDRLLLQRIDGTFAGATMREGIHQYDPPRTLRLSVSYRF